jgi:hypothetical protein
MEFGKEMRVFVLKGVFFNGIFLIFKLELLG